MARSTDKASIAKPSIYCADDGHAVCAIVSQRGWRRVREPAAATLVLPNLPVQEDDDTSCGCCVRRGWTCSRSNLKGTCSASACGGNGGAGGWVWASDCQHLDDKAKFFESLNRFVSATAAEAVWPETWIFKNRADILAWAAETSAALGFYVKHPRAGGGSGTNFARSAGDACALARSALADAGDAIVVQRAVAPATLPKGPSIFELRVWALLRCDRAWLFSEHRAKTATRGLMNKAVQTTEADYGQFYVLNMASEAEVRSAVAGYDTTTAPNIRAAVRIAHAALRGRLDARAFYWVGFDFIVDEQSSAWLIEANVKSHWRYDALDPWQFPSRIVRDLAREAVLDLVELIEQPRAERPRHGAAAADDDAPRGRWLPLDDEPPSDLG